MSEEQASQSTDNIGQSIIQVQFLNFLMNNNTIQPILEFEIGEEYFPGYEKEFNYLVDFWKDSKVKDGKGTLPDKVRFAVDFPDFPLFETGPAINTLFSQLHEQRCYAMFVETLQKSAELSKTSSFEAIEFGKHEMDKLFKFSNNTLGSGKDLIRGANERLEDYIKRVSLSGLLGIKTGDPELDKYLFGWLPEDFVVIIARTNEGKSWLLLYYMLQAVLGGKKVGMYSGEMSQLMMGFRFDTLYQQFGNSQLIGGDASLGNLTLPEVGPKALKEYQDYINALLKGDLPELRVFTQKDLGSKMSVNKMRVLQEKHGFDIWGLDQLSLMLDDLKGKEERIRLGNISEACFSFTEDYQIPVLTVHQAGRKAAEAKKKDENAAPTLEDSFGADAIMQNCTRAMAFTQIENGAKCSNIKNRYGQRGKEFLYVWHINHGIFKPLNQQSIRDELF